MLSFVQCPSFCSSFYGNRCVLIYTSYVSWNNIVSPPSPEKEALHIGISDGVCQLLVLAVDYSLLMLWYFPCLCLGLWWPVLMWGEQIPVNRLVAYKPPAQNMLKQDSGFTFFVTDAMTHKQSWKFSWWSVFIQAAIWEGKEQDYLLMDLDGFIHVFSYMS